MYQTFYLVIVAVGLIGTLATFGWKQEVELFSGISAIAWLYVVFASNSLVVMDQTGATHTFGSGAMQLFAAMLSLISILAVIGSLSGRWPGGNQ